MIEFMIGLPRSGKSTYSKEWRERTGGIVVCADQIRLALTGQAFYGPAEPIVRAVKHTIIRVYHQQGLPVLVDGTHTTEKSILELLYIDPEAKPVWLPDIETYQKNLQGWVCVCHNRARATNQDYLVPVINRMSEQIKELVRDFDRKLEALREKAQ